ncbi:MULTISPECIES: hypothetical protein [Peptoniphilus]|uniref:Rod shape-determining protein MreC n=1 Tax=Peptoniphilus hominis (ex Hitch et al. 2025) TaxID=3133174 RepID=A0ABV1CF42_9FIRM|nr:hypothetical protein [Peptoniphilus grossensis]MDU5100575.1 hypothetical protein [Peptoniphilus grossensis]MDU7151827.1 hypothetical protein [Peptoniphilus grossensis]
MKKALKIIGIIALVVILMKLFNISIFVGNQKIDRQLIIQGIRNFNLGDLYDKVTNFFNELVGGIKRAVGSL